ncbi:MAG TPA: PQQ-dependent sugar dehydrogenase [Gemmatimonadaceae bacterium]|jgi:glucose/arabinose dehydrogenase|nr:PQQ-dependent sugar dehydrogenase [Gemmatimonadaceae bacterium]
MTVPTTDPTPHNAMRRAPLTFLAAIAFLLAPPAAAAQSTPDTIGAGWEFDSQVYRYRVEVVATGFRVPFGLAFLPDGRLLVSDRVGILSLVDVRTGTTTRVDGTPPTSALADTVDGGLLDVAVHPNHAQNGWLYLSYAEESDSGNATVVERARLRENRLVERQRLFTAFPAVAGYHHFGSRLALANGYLFITLGERDIPPLAQELWTHFGKVVRLHDDGRVPADNPFTGRPGARPEIWSYGHRNAHGLAVHPATGELWESEHGPLGGDEINIVRRGANYGWPTVTFGREYDGGVVGDGRAQAPGMEPPAHHYSTSAALSGIAFYTGSAFPRWRDNLFVGAMAPRFLARLVIADGRVRTEERLLLEKRWRVRAVQTGPDGFIYLAVQRTPDGNGGLIARLRPVEP